MKQGERIELRLPREFAEARQLAPDGRGRPLPAGSTWDAASNTFYWEPAAAFLGSYELVFTGNGERVRVRVFVDAPRK